MARSLTFNRRRSLAEFAKLIGFGGSSAALKSYIEFREKVLGVEVLIRRTRADGKQTFAVTIPRIRKYLPELLGEALPDALTKKTEKSAPAPAKSAPVLSQVAHGPQGVPVALAPVMRAMLDYVRTEITAAAWRVLQRDYGPKVEELEKRVCELETQVKKRAQKETGFNSPVISHQVIP